MSDAGPVADPVAALIARDAIQQLYQRYARAADRLDRTEMERLYHPGALEDHGFYVGPAAGFIDRHFDMAAAQGVTHHLIAPALIEIDGDFAAAEAYFLVYQRGSGADGAHQDELFGGRYVDRLERRAGEWRFTYRRLVLDYSRAEPSRPWLTDELRAQLRVIEGRRDASDEIYSRHSKTRPSTDERTSHAG